LQNGNDSCTRRYYKKRALSYEQDSYKIHFLSILDDVQEHKTETIAPEIKQAMFSKLFSVLLSLAIVVKRIFIIINQEHTYFIAKNKIKSILLLWLVLNPGVLCDIHGDESFIWSLIFYEINAFICQRLNQRH
jgi:hypothetical protein